MRPVLPDKPGVVHCILMYSYHRVCVSYMRELRGTPELLLHWVTGVCFDLLQHTQNIVVYIIVSGTLVESALLHVHRNLVHSASCDISMYFVAATLWLTVLRDESKADTSLCFTIFDLLSTQQPLAYYEICCKSNILDCFD